MDLSPCIDCPPSLLQTLVAFAVGAFSVWIAVRLRRHAQHEFAQGLASLVLFAAVLWNVLLALTFIVPHLHHAMWLPTYGLTLIADAAIGTTWLVLTLFYVFKQRPSGGA
jgi:hypothetical protein